ncbi:MULTISPECIES: hypothetical protein [unclassified Streptomyces]|uniref:hypothetical protein n=1 Tax=unclassified Streptomyces TaxID=2593676 RepID=UPI003077770A
MSFGPPPSMTQPAPTEPTSVRKRGWKVLTALLAVVVAAALGTGGWLLWGGGENGTPSDKPQAAGEQGPLDVRETVEKQPPGTVGEMAFRFSVDDMAPGEHVEMPGTWATDRILAKGINKTLVGMRIGTDIAPGEEEWRLGLDGPICGYTRHVTGDHRTAVLFRANDREEDAFCNQVAFVDLDDGRLVWEDRFSYSVAGPGPGFATGSSSQDRPSVTLTHDTVAVTWGGGTVGYDMEEGGEPVGHEGHRSLPGHGSGRRPRAADPSDVLEHRRERAGHVLAARHLQGAQGRPGHGPDPVDVLRRQGHP